MEAKHELFWTQADFGYVKDIVDSMMKLCKPQHKVRRVCIELNLTSRSTGRLIFKLF